MVDKKAQIKAPVKIVTVPKDITRANHLESVTDPGKSSPSMLANSRSSSDHEICPESASGVPESGKSTLKISEQSWRHNLTTIFEVACMKKLDEEKSHLPRLELPSIILQQFLPILGSYGTMMKITNHMSIRWFMRKVLRVRMCI